jgi:hypothetical protein
MAVRFAGTTDQLTYSGTLPTSTAGISLTCWVYLSVDQNDWSCFTRFNEGGTSVIYLTTDSSGTDMGWFSAAGSITGFSFTVGQWHRVAATLSGTSATLYTATAMGAVTVGTATLLTGAPTELGIGGRGAGDSSEPFNGRVAGWKLWNGVLTRAEIETEWRQLLPVRTAGLHAAYSRLSGRADGRLDHSGNGRMLASGATAANTEDDPPVPLRLATPVRILSAPGGTTFAVSVSGATAPAGSLAKQDQKPVAGSTTPTGALRKLVARALTGTATPTGALIRQVGKQATGSMAPAGSLAKRTARTFTAAVTPTGVLGSIRTRLLSLAGAITPVGALVRQPGKALAGSVTPVAGIVKRIAATRVGTTSPVGSVLKLLGRLLGGSTAPIGATGTAIGGGSVAWPPTFDPPVVTAPYTADPPVITVGATADPPVVTVLFSTDVPVVI